GLVYREHGACDECANRLHANTSTTCLQVQVRMQSGLSFRQGVPPHATDLFKNPWYRTPEATVLALATQARGFHVLGCPDKIACHWAQGDNERPVPRACDKQLDFVEMAPR